MILVLHDYFEIPDGGARLSLILTKALNADLCCGFKLSDHPFINNSKKSYRQHALCQGWLPPPPFKQYIIARAFRKKTSFLKKYRQIIYSGSYAPLAVHHASEALNICYCHIPPRFIFDQKEHFLEKIPFWQRHAMRIYLKRFELLYKNAMRSIDIIVANSQNIHNRIFTYLGLDSTIINPPVDTSRFK